LSTADPHYITSRRSKLDKKTQNWYCKCTDLIAIVLKTVSFPSKCHSQAIAVTKTPPRMGAAQGKGRTLTMATHVHSRKEEVKCFP